MNRAYYSDTINDFLDNSPDTILSQLVQSASAGGASIDSAQVDAWREQINILNLAPPSYRNLGSLYFEYSIPRLGKRIDVLALIGSGLFVLEFKVGETKYTGPALDQVCDYALDLKNFHETSHDVPIAPIRHATPSSTIRRSST